MTHVVALGADDEASVRMPSAEEQAEYEFAPDEPVVEIWRWNGITEIYSAHDTSFAFVSGDSEPDRAERLGKIRQIVDDLQQAIADGRRVPTEERLVVRYGVGRTTLRRALAELRARGLLAP